MAVQFQLDVEKFVVCQCEICGINNSFNFCIRRVRLRHMNRDIPINIVVNSPMKVFEFMAYIYLHPTFNLIVNSTCFVLNAQNLHENQSSYV